MVRTFFALGCLMLCLGLFSCYDENGTYGSDLVDSAFRNVRIDTSTVVVTSVLIDSLETSGKNVALVGRYKHSLWGVVSSHSFIAYERPSYFLSAVRTNSACFLNYFLGILALRKA